MKCAEFECRLAELMGGDCEQADRDDRIEELRAHARGCPECRATVDLLDLLDSPAGDRDFVDAPGDAYWSSFDDRLRARIHELPSRRMSIWALGSAAAAAVVLVVASGGWGRDVSGLARPTGTEPIPFDLVHDASIELDPIEFPDDLNDLLVRTTPADVELAAGFVGLDPWSEALALSSEFDPAWVESLGERSLSARESAGLYPDLSALDLNLRVELLEWLNSQTGV